ncbi:chemotaxis protein CheW [Jannaschia seohaensis]|uniref:Purine-binding chemotaxis protein CheW n=1 Tax=Jannaschia seohaensis TaxID=475081 RepID=A0A2Y9B5S4_9RHOB|nr:chemotaxis protein CheW [Jannaschia seohaensis]PWJ10187.1 purine-binding chemotaxis protein CheW [Jannaschia seohaensis]SSA51760.1 purine-binding chemotaxis protein CheW [Jannaschia seohaensis]
MPASTPVTAAEPAWNPLEILDTDLDAPEEGVDDTTQAYLIFQLHGQWLAASVAQVREILDDQPLTPLPNAPHDVEGMIDVRSKGVAVVDLAHHLGIRSQGRSEPERIVVFEFERGDRPPLAIGVRTETVRDVRQIGEAEIEPTPEALGRWDQTMIQGVTRVDDRIVVLVDPSSLVRRPDAADDAFDFE